MRCRRLPPALLFMFVVVSLAPFRSLAQTCPGPPVFCEGWSRDSSHREVSLTRTLYCNNGACLATCSTSPITALPSVRIGSLNHIVLGFSVPDACAPECPGAEPCYNVGVSFRRLVSTTSEAPTGIFDCDPTDPMLLSAGATFDAAYATGAEAITISNVVYGPGGGADACGTPPSSLDLVASGWSGSIQSHFTFTWDATNSQVVAYTEARTYSSLPPPNTVNITVTSIDRVAGTYVVSAADAPTRTLGSSWGRLKVRYR